MFAVIQAGGKQLQVEPGQTVLVEKLPVAEGDEIIFDRVLMVGDENQARLGTPVVEGARVIGKVTRQGRCRKVIVFKYIPKKRVRRKKGHRQPFSQVLIERIEA